MKKIYECPFCRGAMKAKEGYDSIKMLYCKDCKCTITFGTWESQKQYTDDIAIWESYDLEE